MVDYRRAQLAKLPGVELAFGSRLEADEILSYGFDHVALATGARWRRDGTARWHTRPIPIGDGAAVMTPDDLMAGERPAGDRVVLFDDDHYYMGGVLAELLAADGMQVTLVTPAARVSEWTVNTMEQQRIQRRLLDQGVRILTTQVLVAADAGAVQIACAYTERQQELACDALVLVTARDPDDSLAVELAGRSAEWEAAGVRSVQAVGDAWAPATIAAAVWDGRRYAETLDQPDQREVTFLREIVQLADA